jgi:DNA primase
LVALGQNAPVSIPQSFIQELLARVDVVEVVGRYVQLKKGGANFMGLCPFHGEKSPSFSVSPAKQFYHCFGCGANGNAISFLMEHAGMSFIESVKDLAQQTGMQVPQEDVAPHERERQNALRAQQQSLTQVLEDAAKGYQKHLKTSPRAIQYLKGRGLSGEIARQFGLGYAPEGWRALASMVPDYADPRLVECGLVIAQEATTPTETDATAAPQDARSAKRYDRFRDRIMFPIRSVKGETIGFGGRVLDKGEPKYLNSPETPVFSKGRELYGLFEARTAIRTAGYALVTEGYMDVVALAQLGFANAVATLGTACTPDHLQKLFRFTDAVVFSFDGDAAGRRAAGKAMVAALPLAQDTRSIKFLFLPAEDDPDSYIRANGTEAFAQCVQQAMPLSQFMQESAAARCDLNTAEGRALMASNARPLWTALPDGALRRQLLGEFAQRIGLSVPELSDLWKLQPSAHTSPRKFESEVSNENGRYDDFHHENYSSFEEHGPWAMDDGLPAAPQARHQPKPAWRKNDNNPGGVGKEGRGKFGPRQPPGVRRSADAPLNTRADILARLLLSHDQACDWLTTDDHHLLAKQPDPMGALFRWLDSQWHEHGAQPWPERQQAMQGQVFEATIHRLMTQALALQTPPDDADQLHADAQREVREVLQRMHIDDLKARENQALAEANHRPEALQTYRELHERLQALQKEVQMQQHSQKL